MDGVRGDLVNFECVCRFAILCEEIGEFECVRLAIS